MLGVSIIIYTLVRLMPSDYIDTKYSSQLQIGTITQEDLDRFKELYGLYVPEAYLNIDVDEYGNFERDVKTADHDHAILADQTFDEWVVGRYTNGNKRLDLEDDGTFSLYEVSYTVQIQEVQIDNGDGTFTTEEREIRKEVRTELMSGTYTATYTPEEKNAAFDEQLSQQQMRFPQKYSIVLMSGGAQVPTSVSYRVASGWERLGAILGGYFTWIGNLCKGDLGTSFLYEKPVNEVISQNMWVSFAIAIIATILQFLIAIPLGISSAIK